MLWCGAAATRRRRRQRRTWQDSGVWRRVARAARRGGGGTSDHFNARLTCAWTGEDLYYTSRSLKNAYIGEMRGSNKRMTPNLINYPEPRCHFFDTGQKSNLKCIVVKWPNLILSIQRSCSAPKKGFKYFRENAETNFRTKVIIRSARLNNSKRLYNNARHFCMFFYGE